jgi:Icc-related predicted phosphoesterase
MKILHISDTHGFHEQLTNKWNWDEIDLVIHSGDESNNRIPEINYYESIDFFNWFQQIPVKHKVFIAGNHSTAIEKRLITPGDIHSKGIIYLENSLTEIEGVKIWGSPITPQFGNWSFMKQRHKLDKLWSNIPDETDILVIHGPAKGILDLSWSMDGYLEYCGCKSLFNHVLRIKPKVFQFGHIHDGNNIVNYGVRNFNETNFINSALVQDGRMDKGLIHYGVLTEINENKEIKIIEIK